MKDRHARTHVFTIDITNELNYEVTPIQVYERENKITFDHVPNIFALLGRLNEDGEPPMPFGYATPDYMDAILALFVLVEYDYIDACTANETAMKFTEAFYGFEVPKD